MMCKGSKFNWTEQCNNAFESLKTALCSSPVMSIADPDWKFIVKVDSCKTGIGCILEQENLITKERTVIEYASQKYNDTQQRYPAIELEVCGLLFAIKHWKHYLIGKHFVVETDSKAVEWIKDKRDLIGKLGRWSLYLENFDFSTVHVPGKIHIAPDSLNRMYETDMCQIEVNDSFISNVPDSFDVNEWHNEIDKDQNLQKLVNKDVVCNNDVYVKSTDNNVLIVPVSARKDILTYLHDNYGHSGIDK